MLNRLTRTQMKNNESKGTSGGIGFVGLLTIGCITLKLPGKIRWSWAWVLSPIWISIIICVALIIIVFIAAVIKVGITK